MSSIRSLLLVAPTRRELCGVTPSPPLLQTGIVGLGDSAGQTLSGLIDETRPDLVVSIGFAGALQPDMEAGDVVLCDSVRLGVSSQHPRFNLESAQRHLMISLFTKNGLEVRDGDLVTVAYPLIHATDKRIHGSRTGAVAVEMEGYSLAMAASQGNVPIVMLRSILDPVSRELPELVIRIINDHGKNEWRHALQAVVGNPKMIVTLIRLAREARLASRSLSMYIGTIKHALLGR